MNNKRAIRPDRVAQLIRRCLSELLLYTASDPRLKAIHVSRVTVSHDLGHAKIFIHPSAQVPLEDRVPSCAAFQRQVQQLNQEDRFIRWLRTAMAQQITLRRVPEIRFYMDQDNDVVA